MNIFKYTPEGRTGLLELEAICLICLSSYQQISYLIKGYMPIVDNYWRTYMKIQLDTKNKVIKLEDSVNIGEFVKKLKEMLPKEWDKFSLETNTVINNWNNPIVVREYPHRPYWDWPYYCTTNDNIKLANSDLKATYELKDGLFNVEL